MERHTDRFLHKSEKFVENGPRAVPFCLTITRRGRVSRPDYPPRMVSWEAKRLPYGAYGRNKSKNFLNTIKITAAEKSAADRFSDINQLVAMARKPAKLSGSSYTVTLRCVSEAR